MNQPASTDAGQSAPSTRWEAPAFEVIPLGCEITAYAPDDDPRF
jgi:coenzyme PQQ precursor peptide PqqA